jgi:succinate dehydrogenase/fumarate reductase-like Fe-S protein
VGIADQELWRKKEEDIKLVMNKVVDERLLKGDFIIDESMWQEDRRPFFAATYRSINVSLEFEKGVQPNDANIYYNFSCLRMQISRAEEEIKCAGLAYWDQKKKGKNVYLCAPDSIGPEMSLEMVEHLLNDLQAEKWTLETLKEKIPVECKTDINCEEICPNTEAGYQEVIKGFEVRICLWVKKLQISKSYYFSVKDQEAGVPHF